MRETVVQHDRVLASHSGATLCAVFIFFFPFVLFFSAFSRWVNMSTLRFGPNFGRVMHTLVTHASRDSNGDAQGTESPFTALTTHRLLFCRS